MTTKTPKRLCQLSLSGSLLRSLPQSLLYLFILFFSTYGYAQKVVNSQLIDVRLEVKLDNYLAVASESEAQAKVLLEDIIAQVTAETPLITRVRALGYRASELAYEEKFTQAYALLDRLKQASEQAQVIDAQAEVLASRIDFMVMEGKRGDAFLRVPRLERLLEKTQTARIRYYGHNLLSSIYVDWERFEPALQHLLQAQQALGEMNSSLNEGRRLYLLSRIANIQLSLEQWDAAILTVEETVPEAIDKGYQGLAYDLWFSKYYAEISLGQLEQALRSLNRAYQMAQELEASYQEVIILNNFGDTYLRLEQFDEAREHLLEALDKAEALGFDGMLSTINFNLGFIAVKQGDSLGIKQMEEAVANFRETLSNSQLEMALGELAEAYALVNDHAAEAQILRERINLKERILTQSQREKMSELQAVYKSRDDAQQIELLQKQNELKEQIIKNSEQQRIVWILFTAFAAVCLVLVFLLYRKSKRANQQLNRANEQLADQSLKDPLTGLWNRRALQERMLERARSDERSQDGLLLLDIDRFKQINDRHGHAGGDKVLTELSKRLQNICRDSDILVRWGGEEFLFYVKGIKQSSLLQLAERILRTVAEHPIKINGELISITTSIGFIELPFADLSEHQVDWERALQIADMALYTCKARGRNRACGVTELLVDYDTARIALEHDLNQAMNNNWITLTVIEGPQQ
ncbi:hypothetical protein C5610_11990 [Idiomarina sp. OT37-5b]|jgi:diguanylate cyclase (GGDEF)-like protein|uniref:tetratricopeptide repeat-containing diguanylate cyclase n=1 Tax=Idiomarina sp. OT37-5b TaxID=2100422 RepID=UPI000CFA1C5E|nr:tetratricopeptide repeat-containing diguanylate cyclase [Idiomarina sp. OT37-5b]AVJ56937.1 hypothetical protein C5610_11990 [Idiomarina sp. OT37-5b]